MQDLLYALTWWLLSVVIGLLAFPLMLRICRGLPDRGYSAAKAVGLIVVTYLVWLLPSFKVVPFGRPVIVIGVGVLAVLSFIAVARAKWLTRQDFPFRYLILSEAIYAVAFIFFTWMLWQRPDIYPSQLEDFANFGFIQSIQRSSYFPPADPWFAGRSLPYYYGGHLIVAWMGRIGGMPSEVAFNLGSAGFYALAASLSFGLGYNLTRKVSYALLTSVVTAFAGYITGLLQLLAWLFRTDLLGFAPSAARDLGQWLASFDWGSTIRIIPNTVTFYPFYIMGNADVHPMATSVPFQILSLQLALLVAWGRKSESRLVGLLKWSIVALCLGFLIFINTWAYPVFLLLLVLVFIFFRRPLWKLLYVSALSIVFFLPFLLSRAVQGFHGFGVVTERTPLYAYAGIAGVFWLILFCLLFSFQPLRKKRLLLAGLAVLVGGLGFLMGDFQLLVLLLPALAAMVPLLMAGDLVRQDRFVLLLIGMGIALALGADLLYVRDSYGPPFERYNTIMKLYLMQWVFLGAACSYALFRMKDLLGRRAKAVIFSLSGILLAALLVHPVAATAAWTSGQATSFGPGRGTLDGLAYLEGAHRGDYQAIRWLNANVAGSPVIAEAPTEMEIGVYNARVASMTGLPALLGWGPWEVQWGRDWDDVIERAQDAAKLYDSEDVEAARDMVKKYGITYIYVGELEKKTYSAVGLAKFDAATEYFEKVYDADGVAIYRAW